MSESSNDLTPEQERARYTYLSPAKVAPLIGVGSAEHVRKLILDGDLEAMDVGRGKVARYKVAPEAVERFKRRRARVQERLEERRRKRGGGDEAAA